ncbi:hypothetical protein KAI65_05560 [Candidatus Parcubacteria bacterium]|nr:hypothetical protein [Candidatus Parcubacteria bacterium]
MKIKIQKQGNSFGVRIQMKIIENNLPKKISLKKMLNKINSNNIHKEIDLGNICENEIW